MCGYILQQIDVSTNWVSDIGARVAIHLSDRERAATHLGLTLIDMASG